MCERTERTLDRGEIVVRGCLRDGLQREAQGGFPNGWLLCGKRSSLYRIDGEERDSIEKVSEFDNSTQYEDLVEALRKM